MIRTTKDFYNIPRLLIRLSGENKRMMTEKEIVTDDGRKISLCTKALGYQEVDKWELSVCIGKVIGMSPGCEGFLVGDLVMLDYVIDSDEQYLVQMDGQDKIVCVPCKTRLHDKEITITSYGKWEFEKKTRRPVKFHYTGERNQYIAKEGDVDQLSLVLGIFRDDKIIPTDNYLFCEKKEEKKEYILHAGLFAKPQDEDKCTVRTVVFAPASSPIQPGMKVYAMKDSEIELRLFDQVFEIVPLHDAFAYQD